MYDTVLGYLSCYTGDDSFVVGIQFFGVDVCGLNVPARIIGNKIFYFANLILAFETGGLEYLFPCDGCIGIDLSASVLYQQLFGRWGLL